MYKLRSLLFIQILIAILLGLILTSGALFYSKSTIKDEHLLVTRLIEHIANSTEFESPLALSAELKSNIDFSVLKLSNENGDTFYSFKQNQTPSPIFTNLIEKIQLLPNKSLYKSDRSGLIIEFQPSYQKSLRTLFYLLLLLFFLPSIIIILSYLLFRTACLQIFASVSHAITNSIDEIIETKAIKTSNTATNLPIQFEPLKIALTKLHCFFTNTVEEFETSTNEIREQATTDPLTRLPNRTKFVEFFENEINPEQKKGAFGIILLVRASQLLQINQDEGYEAGDTYIKTVADILISCTGTYQVASNYRINSSDFSIIIPNMTPKEAETLANKIHSKLNDYMQVSHLSAVAYMGIVSYSNGKPLGELLASADTAVSLAQQKQPNGWHIYKESENNNADGHPLGRQNWRDIIDHVLTTKSVTLFFQSIQAVNKSNRSYTEVLSRFHDHDDNIVPTAHFIAMAEKLNKIVDVDKLVVESVITQMKKKNLGNQFFGINLTSTSIHDEQFLIWLERRLLKDSQIATKLIFEVTEFGLQQHINSSRRFIEMMHRAGSRVTVEKFGVGITSFKFFQELKPDFIKLDGSYVRNIEDNKNNQYFIRMIVDLSHRIGVSVLAEYVETQEEKHVMQTLMVDGCQGYYIDSPSEHLS